MSDVVIVGAKRTAIGSFLGQFTGTPTPALGSAAITGALAQAGLSADKVDEVIMGCVLPAGLGQAPARQASRSAGISDAAGCTTINKVCGSGMKAVMLAHDIIKAGSAQAVVAGGMESMTNAPHLLNNSRTGIRYGSAEMLDHMAWDGLTNPYDGKAMGVFGDAACAKYGYDRAAIDGFSAESARRAQAAQAAGAFDAEITPVTVKTRKGEVVIAKDEEPGKIDLNKIPELRAAFGKDGVLTAASSSKISDGAAALVVMSADAAAAAGIKPLARIKAHATHAQAPEWFTTAPVAAVQNVLAKAGWNVVDVDLFEINEAFACVAMAPMSDLGIPHDKLNVNGGALALGHPIGCSGARLLVTLIHALQARGGKRGVASLCIGGGEATAMAIELV
ncbi:MULTISPECIES: acetyl-CoA C-acyltransferase [Thermomonas]|uniref:Acetyl-CoA C-acyltransferase n=1 Tax=Thermomonas beijingensis TaxID=2872701 RepID=A0ABS7TGT2_9GAMM|nr:MULTISPECIES: acetyl-CoA C-acyltransferase [Thermomonas]MBS0459642.1 acetyl-CoA C-acyltransferase [Pseudomonadota bacterium]MBZ4187079.1 acetyl-CoA C-acyltransferase [Thermomonas beijingensis]MDE2381203.1 acetyl-CoA C-acyltransferase [Xanthomonadaceae bacterium]HQA02670.1 acetyl-CoA C-acyltransferase [Thermomonas sp.]